jgi:hypothetical protein
LLQAVNAEHHVLEVTKDRYSKGYPLPFEQQERKREEPTLAMSIGSSTLVCYEKFERIETSQPRVVLLKMIIYIEKA